jgi:replicative DNA helicase
MTDYEPGDSWGAPRVLAGPGSNDRTPPQDNAAEQSVLGSMLLSKDAIADVVEVLRGIDFYRPATSHLRRDHRPLRPRRAGRPDHRRQRAAEAGELQRVGGAPYLHTLSANVPIAANAGYYAEIVKEKAILRRLVDAGTKIVQLGYAGEGESTTSSTRRRPRSTAVTDRRTKEDYVPLSDVMEASSTRSRRSATARPASTACRPASPTSTS